MVSSQIANLSEDDLLLLEKLIGSAYSEEYENAKAWKSKNGYAPPDRTKTLLRLLNAVSSQRKLTSMPKW
jgi:hypothetical protein